MIETEYTAADVRKHIALALDHKLVSVRCGAYEVRRQASSRDIVISPLAARILLAENTENERNQKLMKE